MMADSTKFQKTLITMKWIFLFLIFLSTYMGGYFLLSLIGLIWWSYYDVISFVPWFVLYGVFFGWWAPTAVARHYYLDNKTYFDR